jgi:hypothetical protein
MVRPILFLLLATVSFAAADVRRTLTTDHFEIVGGQVPGNDTVAMLEAMYDQWKAKLGAGAGVPGKLKVAFHFSAPEYAREASLEFRFAVKEGTLHILGTPDHPSSVSAGGALLYVSTVYPNIASRKDAMWLLAGLRVYFAGADWSRGSLQIDSLKLPSALMNALAIQTMLKKGDWWAMDKAIAGTPMEIETRRLMHDLGAWAAWWVIFNAPGEGGAGRSASAVPEFLAALDAGKKTEEAFKAFQKSANIAGPQGVDKLAREYFLKQRLDVPDKDLGEDLTAETAHYSILLQKSTDRKATGAESGGIAKKRVDEARFLADLKWKMELMYEKYHLAFRLQRQPHRKSKIKIYSSEVRYWASGGPKGSAAYYNKVTKEMVGYLSSADFDPLFNVLSHEGCHQFFDMAFPQYQDGEVPMWFSEGFADCLGANEVRGKELHVFTVKGLGGSHLRNFKARNATLIGLDDLLRFDRDAFMGGGADNYARAWSFVHFLWNYPTIDAGHGEYSEVLIRMIDGFKAGKSKDEVWREAFQKFGKPLDVQKVEKEWHGYTKALPTRD